MSNTVNLILERKKSAKGNDYFSLAFDYGYRKQSITFDTSIICSLLDITERALYDTVQVDESIEVGSIILKD